MEKVCLVHNPYLNNTLIYVNDELVKEGPLCELVRDKRLQYWLEDFFPKLTEYLNIRAFELSFKGIEQDYNDLVEELKKEKYTACKINLKHIEKEYSEPDIKINKLRELFEKATKGPIKEFKEKELRERFSKALSPEFEMCVIANMSAGKSTFINSILGKDLLPSKNQACTATITTITDYDELKTFRGRIRTKDDLSKWSSLDAEDLWEWNNDEIEEIEIQGNIPMIKSENIRLVLVDTPGPNCSENPQHRERTFWSIQNDQKSLIIYLLDSTILSTIDDKTLLERVSKEMEKKGKQSVERFLFVLNKVDNYDSEKESIHDLVEQVKIYLEKNSLKNALVYPVSARTTKLIRSKLKGDRLTRAEITELDKCKSNFNEFLDDETGEDLNKDFQLHQYMPLTPSVKKIVDKKLSDAKSKGDEYEIAMLNSGIPVVEAVIQEYLDKYALPTNIYDAWKTMENILNKHNVLNRLNEKINSNKDELEKLNAEIKAAQKRAADGEEAKVFREMIQDYKWSKSKKFTGSIRVKERQFNNLINTKQSELGNGEKTVENAVKIINQVNRSLQQAISDVRGEINRIIEEEVVDYIKEVESGYNQYVKDLLGVSLDYSMVFDSLEKTASYFFNVHDLIERARYTKTEVIDKHHIPTTNAGVKTVASVGISMALLGLIGIPIGLGAAALLTQGDEVDITAEIDYVEMSNIASSYNEMRAWFIEEQERAEKMAKLTIDKKKEEFLSQMDRIDQEIEELLKEYNEKTSSVSALENSLKKDEVRREWLEGFQAELEEVLSI